MRTFLLFLVGVLGIAFAPLAFAAEGHAVAAPAGHAEHAEKEGIPLYAAPVAKFGPLVLTNSMVITWAVAILLIIGAQLAMRNVRMVPQGAQNFWEWLVEGLDDFLGGIMGADLARKTFWFFATLFILVLATNWAGLIPGVGSIGWGHPDENGHFHHFTTSLLRGANADLNMTLAMSLVFFACWIVWALQANGPGGFVMHIFGPKGDTTGIMKWGMIVVFLAVGVLEVVSIAFRPVSLSFRLYGNIFAGENMLETMATLVPGFGWLIPIPFYFMELLVGMVQALVFMLLTAVFTLLICSHDEEHAHEPAHGHAGEHKH